MSTRAILLGSFDPPTIGHMHLISEAIKVGVSDVVVIPSWRNPWKHNQTPYETRLEMTKILESVYPEVTVSDIEKRLATEGLPRDFLPTCVLLRGLKKELGEFKIITTNETYLEMSEWIEGAEILRDHEFLIFSTSHLGDTIPGSIRITDLNVSSSMVRQKMHLGYNVSEYLLKDVYEYIKQNKVYENIGYYRPSE